MGGDGEMGGGGEMEGDVETLRKHVEEKWQEGKGKRKQHFVVSYCYARDSAMTQRWCARWINDLLPTVIRVGHGHWLCSTSE